jgi:hypothetical protein
MGWFVSTELVPVDLEGCRCDGSPHDHDTVWLYPEVPPDLGLACVAAWNNGAANVESMVGILSRLYVQFGIARWTFLDEKGDPVPLNHRNVARLDWDAVRPIAEKADELYAEKITRPLVAAVSKSSRNGRTAQSTPARTRSSAKPRKR